MAAAIETGEAPLLERALLYDLALAFDWEYDREFIRLIDEAARGLRLRTVIISTDNLSEILPRVRARELDFLILFDRASGATPDFMSLQSLALLHGRDVIDPVERLRWASDKATMHLELIAHGLHTPHTVILPSYESEKEYPLSAEELAPLGSPFIIKPANTTGGSLGVIENALGPEDALLARLSYPRDKYLLQEKIVPEEKGDKRFWFRGFYVLGEVHVTWWDDRTHVYSEFRPEDEWVCPLEPLTAVVRGIAAISGLRFFSTEIVRDIRGRLLSVDYVNEICDMRLQSLHPDGVPDAVVRKIASRIASYVHESVTPGRS